MATKKTKTKITKKKTAKKKIVEKKYEAEDLLVELQARFDAMEEKLDTLLSRTAMLSRMVSAERDPDFKTRATVTKKPPIPQDSNPRERRMHKAVCAQCKQNCEVPFVPRSNRPVYCKTCFSSRRKDSSPRNLLDKEELVAEISKTLNIDMTEQFNPKAVVTKKTKSKASSKKTKGKVSKVKNPKAKAKVPKAKTKKTKSKK